MNEFADKLHDKAGADGLFSSDDKKPQALAQGPPPPTTPKGGPHALSEKNMWRAPAP